MFAGVMFLLAAVVIVISGSSWARKRKSGRDKSDRRAED
jgi:membrane protein implicated in regulation of membrane protease activity